METEIPWRVPEQMVAAFCNISSPEHSSGPVTSALEVTEAVCDWSTNDASAVEMALLTSAVTVSSTFSWRVATSADWSVVL